MATLMSVLMVTHVAVMLYTSPVVWCLQ